MSFSKKRYHDGENCLDIQKDRPTFSDVFSTPECNFRFSCGRKVGLKVEELVAWTQSILLTSKKS